MLRLSFSASGTRRLAGRITLVCLFVYIATCTSDKGVGPGSGVTQLAFTVEPSNVVAGTAIAPAVVVEAQDASGKPVKTFKANVTVSIASNPGGVTLSGTLTVAAVGGVATFSNLIIDKTGASVQLQAASGTLTSAQSTPFVIGPGQATQLAFTGEPTTTPDGTGISPAVAVTAQDALGNTVTDFNGNITVAITAGSGSTGATLAGPTTVAAVSGVATFAALTIDKVGTGYELSATTAGLSAASSTTFDITAGVASQLVISGQPSNTSAGVAIAPPVQVTARDALGNTATGFSGNVTMAITSGTGSGGATLSGTTTVAAVAGIATFSSLTIAKAGVGYTLSTSTTVTGVTGSTTGPFNIVTGAISHLVFTVQPTPTAAAATISPPIQVMAQDAAGNAVPGFTDSVTVAIGTNPVGGTLAGTTTVAPIGGVATFANLSLDKTGTGYTLKASARGLTATSAAFTINTGEATHLIFTGQPTGTAAGASVTPAVVVTALDAGGNTATGFTGMVKMAIGTNPASGALTGTTSITAVAGVATFSTLKIDKPGTGYTLSATSGTLIPATSAPFDIVVGTASQLAFTVQPSQTPLGKIISPAVKVSAQDAAGNTVTSFVGNVTVAIGTNPSGGALSGTSTVKASSGIATFSNLNISKSGVGYTLLATTTGLSSAVSIPFTITSGAATQLAFTVQPVSTAAGKTITPAVQVTAEDAQGNAATGFTGNVTVAIGTNPAAGTLSGTPTVAAVAGVATFSTLSINNAGNGYTLTAASSGLTGATSPLFDITNGSPGTAALVGQWSAVLPVSIVQVHLHLLFDGRVLSYGENGTPQVWDPATGVFTAVPSPSLEFCGGHTFLPDGRLIMTGGGPGTGLGLPNTNIFDPSTTSWIVEPNMAQGRWYPTSTTLPDGEVVTVSGQDQNKVAVPIPEVWNGTSWRQLTGASLTLPNYPRDFVAPDGRIFYAGEQTQSRWLDVTGAGSWTTGPSMKFGSRLYGSAVMYEVGKILYAGGNATPTNTAEIIDLNQSNPQWTYTGSMTYARWNLNATVLPTGDVLVTGGVAGNRADPTLAVNAAELWNPTSGTWTVMASSAPLLRGYHSTALLLPDGRVIHSGGGDGGGTVTNHNFEIYSPPYLFKGARPSVTAVTGVAGYGQTLLLQTPDGASLIKVTLVRFGSVTHAFDQGQRLVSLSFTQASGGISVTLPASRSVAPPGPYMLFLVNSSGVPSIGRIMILK